MTTTIDTTAGLAPAVREQVEAATHAASVLAAAAERLTISNPTEARLATEFLARAAKAKKDAEAQRKQAVGPLNAQVKQINDAFKNEPARLLDQADRLVRERLLAYEREQEAIRRAEQERLEAERRAEQERLERERRAAEEAAAAVRREAEEAERRRQAEIAAAQDATRQRLAAMDDETLDEIAEAAEGGEDPDLLDAIRAEREHRDQQRQAAQAAQAAADAARAAELRAQVAPAPAVIEQRPLESTSGRAHTTTRWVADVTDPKAVVRAWLDGSVPTEFVTVNESAIGQYIRSAKSSHGNHPGIRYRLETGLAVRTSR